jgi:mannose-6-phosphate isomerase-like protein (cupin superfamily)
MEIVRFWEEEGITIPEPYKRHIKVFLSPDKNNVNEISFHQAIIYPKSKTDYHKHDRPELIIILSGRGISICDEVKTFIEPDMALWVKTGEMHQIINTGEESIKLATVFVPPYTVEQSYKMCLDAAEKEGLSKEG